MGFYWSYTLLLKPPVLIYVLLVTINDMEREPVTMVMATKNPIRYVLINLPLIPSSVDTVAGDVVGTEEEENLNVCLNSITNSHQSVC